MFESGGLGSGRPLFRSSGPEARCLSAALAPAARGPCRRRRLRRRPLCPRSPRTPCPWRHPGSEARLWLARAVADGSGGGSIVNAGQPLPIPGGTPRQRSQAMVWTHPRAQAGPARMMLSTTRLPSLRPCSRSPAQIMPAAAPTRIMRGTAALSRIKPVVALTRIIPTAPLTRMMLLHPAPDATPPFGWPGR